MEEDILRTLSFTIQSTNIYERAFTLLKQQTLKTMHHNISFKDIEEVKAYLTFLCKLVMHNVEL